MKQDSAVEIKNKFKFQMNIPFKERLIMALYISNAK